MGAKRVYQHSDAPLISVIIPSLDGHRGGNVERLSEQLKSQTVKSIEIILSIGVFPNGYARNVGFELARGTYSFFIDDDLTTDDERLLEKCLKGFEDIDDLGLIGPSKQIPPDSNRFQRLCGRQLPLATSPIVDAYTESDMVTHDTGWLIRTELYREMGGEDADLLAGTDPEFKARIRARGLKVICAPRCCTYNPQPPDLRNMIKYAFRKGSYSAWQHRFARDRAFDTVEDHRQNENRPTGLLYRVLRKLAVFARSLFLLKVVRIIFDFSYSTGYVYGLLKRWPPIVRKS